MKKGVLWLIGCLLIQSSLAQKIDIDTNDIVILDSLLISSGTHELNFLKETLKGKRIVLLGENTHYDGVSIEMITRIIRFLNLEMGYTILMTELPFPIIYANLLSCDSENQFIEKMAYTTSYFLSDPMVEFYRWLYTGHTLTCYGMDIGYDKYTLQYLEEYLLSADSLNAERIKKYIKNLRYKEFFFKNENEYTNLVNMTEQLITSKEINKDSTSRVLNKLLFTNILNYAYFMEEMQGVEKKEYNGFWNIRDSCMYENVTYLDSVYHKPKMIIWASAYHIIKDKISDKSNDMPLGLFLNKKYGDEVASFPFVFYHGRSGTISRTRITKYTRKDFYKRGKAPSKSIEKYLHKRAVDFAFLDLTKVNSNFKMHPTYTKKNKMFKYRNWSEYYDGIFFIDTMKPMYGKIYIPD